MTVVQCRSHADLLQPLIRGTLPLGGIVAPATRGPAALMTVFELGAALGVPVLVMCSGRARPHEVIDQAATVRGTQCTAVDVGDLAAGDVLPQLRTSEFPEAIDHSYGDLSLKRNLGLIVGKLAGWPSLLFLDDDIHGLSGARVRKAVGALEHHTAVGMPAEDFPDNSVVCHARRYLPEEKQDVFVSGSALAVNLERANSFFPEIYNEDWLFLAPHVDGRKVAASGRVRQDFYNPFDVPERASKQEFGDVLAEGIFSHLHVGRLHDRLPPSYWRAFLDNRAALVRQAIRHYRKQAARNVLARDTVQSLKHSLAAHSVINPRILIDYVAAWQADQRTWRDYYSGLSQIGDLRRALAHQGLFSISGESSAAAGTRSSVTF
ncbi:MAG TPA: hypothetical protein VLM05_18830 [Mycobacteriales bacterium]|nr:hypothetical protein [Mycobacteriales bacterium]